MDNANGNKASETNPALSFSSVAKNPKTPLVLSAILLFLVVIGWAYYFSGQNQAAYPPVQNHTGNPTKKPIPITPGGIFIAAPANAVNSSPWTFLLSAKPASSTPPSANELFSVFKKVRNAISSRDYQAFIAASSQREAWVVSNPKKITNLTNNGFFIFRRTEPSGKSFFERSAPYNLLFNGPGIFQIFPGAVTPFTKTEDGAFYFDDNETGKMLFVNLSSSWSGYKLTYSVAGYAANETGEAGFVYEAGSWKFDYEAAPTIYIENQNTGDLLSNGTARFFVSNQQVKASDATYVPKQLSIPAKSAVTWAGVSGMIYSTAGPGTPWNSDYMLNSNFTKVFSQPGVYYYEIAYGLNPFSGTIVVS